MGDMKPRRGAAGTVSACGAESQRFGFSLTARRAGCRTGAPAGRPTRMDGRLAQRNARPCHAMPWRSPPPCPPCHDTPCRAMPQLPCPTGPTSLPAPLTSQVANVLVPPLAHIAGGALQAQHGAVQQGGCVPMAATACKCSARSAQAVPVYAAAAAGATAAESGGSGSSSTRKSSGPHPHPPTCSANSPTHPCHPPAAYI